MNTKTFVVWLLLFAPVAFVQPAGAAVDTDQMASNIDGLMAPQVKAKLVSGVIVIARGSRTIFKRAYGMADWERNVPNSSVTRFNIGSITKAMTEAVIAELAAEGRLRLDAPVDEYLEGFPKGPNGGRPTVRQLLTHTAGVPWRVTEPLDETQELHAADIVERVKQRGLLFEPGAKEEYSSAGFTCLARIVEMIEKQPFESVLAERVFKPTHMTSATDETGQRLMAHRAMPYLFGVDHESLSIVSAPYKNLRFLTGAGSVFATPSDMLHFVEGVRTGLFGNELRGRLFGGDTGAWHGIYGRTNGYEASVDVLPSKDLVFVFLANLQSGANWQIREQIRNLLRGKRVASIPLPPPMAASFEAPASFVGEYGPADDPIFISSVDGELLRDENVFYPIAGKQYYIPASSSLMHFERDANGVVTELITIFGDGRRTVRPRMAGK
jgi:CubicO group peptidase (beta-lactamase class C family)